MPDRERVIKWLEECQKPEYSCMNCPYYLEVDESAMDEAVLEHCTDQLMRDALALLREQEPAEPHQEYDSDDGTWYYGCGVCHEAIDPNDAYCRHCGRAVKWDE